MIRLVARLIGLFALAAAFAALVIDGTRSIAANQLLLTPLSAPFASRLPAFQQGIERNLHPFLWDPVATSLLRLPIALVLAIAGLALLQAARPRSPRVGYSTRA